MKIGVGNHTFLKKLDFSLIKHGFYPIPPLVKVIFMINRKGLFKGLENLNDR